MIGALFGGFKSVSKVKEVFYVTEEEHGILPLPKISWTLQRTKYSPLKLVADGLSDIDMLKEAPAFLKVSLSTHIYLTVHKGALAYTKLAGGNNNEKRKLGNNALRCLVLGSAPLRRQ